MARYVACGEVQVQVLPQATEVDMTPAATNAKAHDLRGATYTEEDYADRPQQFQTRTSEGQDASRASGDGPLSTAGNLLDVNEVRYGRIHTAEHKRP